MSIFKIFSKSPKIKRVPRDWQYFTKTRTVDYGYKTKSPYEVYDDEAKGVFQQALRFINSHHVGETKKDHFLQASSKNLVQYIYCFNDGRMDCSGRRISSFLMLDLTPDEAKKYSLNDFATEIYAKKAALKMTYPTGFDLANKLPVNWHEKEFLESCDKNFLAAHSNAFDDWFDADAFVKDNKIWLSQKKENAVVLPNLFVDEKNKQK